MLQEQINKLNPMQREGVLTTEGAVLLLAGAGSGKTRVLTHRIAYLIEKGVNPFNILAITFTNKAAREMKERVAAISDRGNEVWVSTFHSTCVKILRREIDKIGYGNQFTIYDSDDSLRLMKNIFKDKNIGEKYYNPKNVLSEIGNLKDRLITPAEYEQTAGNDFRTKKIVELYYAYENYLKENNCLDFDDLIFKTIELFKARPDILEKYQTRFHYIMVDEYQDTNASQYQLVRMLAGKYGNLCVVGDDDQSIYGWRGADIRNILDFEKDFDNTKVIKLEQNYRSSAIILNAANAVIKNNVARKTKSLWTEQDNGERISVHTAINDTAEAQFICSIIKKGANDGNSYNDFAILYRNNALSRVIEENLIKANIPYRLLGSTRFYDRKEIKDVLCYLKIINNPDDNIAMRRIINVPKRGIGEASVEKVAAVATENHCSIFKMLYQLELVPELKGKAKNLDEFKDTLENLIRYSKTTSIAQLINYVLSETEYTQALLSEGTEEAKNRIENINELVSKAAEFDKNTGGDLSQFLEEVALVADVDGLNEQEDSVVLMTLHSSKGLEFDTVFIAGFEENIFPGFRAIEDPSRTGMEEERRLCYVGITRAKRKLYLTNAKSRFQNGQHSYNPPSRFLRELPSDYIEVIAPKASKLAGNTPKPAYERKTSQYVPQSRYYTRPANIPAPQNVTLDYEVGDMVRHIKFGQGTVKEINSAGADYEVTVEFKIGTKKLMAGLSKLKKIY